MIDLRFLVLKEVKAGKYEYPNEIYEVPVETYLLHHLIVTATLVSAVNGIDEDHDVENNT